MSILAMTTADFSVFSSLLLMKKKKKLQDSSMEHA